MSVIIIMCCRIPTLEHRSNNSCNVMDMACQYLVVSGPALTAPLLADTQRTIIRRICQQLCGDFMSSPYSKLVRCLSTCVVCLALFIPSSAPNIKCMTTALSFIRVIMPRREYFARWHRVELLIIPPWHWRSQYMETPG